MTWHDIGENQSSSAYRKNPFQRRKHLKWNGFYEEMIAEEYDDRLYWREAERKEYFCVKV